MNDIRPCRIRGLTSEKGQKLNGLAATAPFYGFDGKDRRVPVHIEGQPKSMSLKYDNVLFFPTGDSVFEGGIGVGRGTIRDTEFMATAIDNARQQILFREPISGGAERSRGNLRAVEAHLQAHSTTRPANQGIIIMCTDLNVAIAVNWATKGEDVALSAAQEEAFRPVKDLIHQRVQQEGSLVFANFRPHRIQPDGYDPKIRGPRHCGPARMDAVKKGFFKIYPCPCEQYRDAMELWFLEDTGASLTCRNESYLDYGPQEMEAYLMNAVALGDMERLHPETLAKVDPQAFWSCILHIELFCKILQSTLPEKSDLHEQWNELQEGVQLGRELWQEVAGASSCAGEFPPSVISGNNDTDWSIGSDAKHDKVAYGCAFTTLLMMMEAAEGVEGMMKPVSFDLLSFYYPGSEIGRFVSMFQTVHQMEQSHVESGQQLEANDRSRYLKEALWEAGYESNDLDYLSVCGHCGNSSSSNNLAVCSKCHGAAYCNRECQKSAWKNHKKDCSPILAQSRRAVHQLATKHGVQLN